jgi:hypothetical protein
VNIWDLGHFETLKKVGVLDMVEDIYNHEYKASLGCIA